jgi:AAA+ ATPase superfamily predicted ATPase
MRFVGRRREIEALRAARKRSGSTLTALYGRRRVGKSRLIEEAFASDEILKFEGLEGQSTQEQRQHFREILATYSNLTAHRKLQCDSWKTLLIALSEYIGQRKLIVFLDEFQWLAAERTELVSVLKYVWDNYFQKNNNIHLILCGSISSFIVKNVIRSKALYGRIDLKIHLKPLLLSEMKEGFFPKWSFEEVAQIWMALGGIPKYLELCDPKLSFEQNIEKLFFSPYGSLQDELENLFVSHFGKREEYSRIIEILSEKKYLSREEIAKKIGLRSGGGLTKVLAELELADFIHKVPRLSEFRKGRETLYQISDPFLRFYFKFVKPKLKKLTKLRKPLNLQESLPPQSYRTWRGMAFELLCYEHEREIATALGFVSVEYDTGVVVARKNLPGVDLAYSRSDNIITVCEIKFKENVGSDVIEKSKQQVSLLQEHTRKRVQSALISAQPPQKCVSDRNYYVKIVSLDSLFVAIDLMS